MNTEPFKLGNSINGHTLQPGQRWHREDFSLDLFRDAKTEVWKQEMEAAKEALKPFTKE